MFWTVVQRWPSARPLRGSFVLSVIILCYALTAANNTRRRIVSWPSDSKIKRINHVTAGRGPNVTNVLLWICLLSPSPLPLPTALRTRAIRPTTNARVLPGMCLPLIFRFSTWQRDRDYKTFTSLPIVSAVTFHRVVRDSLNGPISFNDRRKYHRRQATKRDGKQRAIVYSRSGRTTMHSLIQLCRIESRLSDAYKSKNVFIKVSCFFHRLPTLR